MVESAAGGLICAALLAVPGASAYCRGGIVVYTGQAWKALRDFDEALLEGHRSATEGNARVRRIIDYLILIDGDIHGGFKSVHQDS